MILTINPGSSSLKYKLFDDSAKEVILDDDITVDGGNVRNHIDACDTMLTKIGPRIDSVKKIGIRVVHGGDKFNKPTLINDDVIKEIDRLSELAPLHNPPAVLIIKELKNKLPNIPVISIFDTSFFSTLPEWSKTYAIPTEISKKYGIHRFGFHGISHNFVLEKVDPKKEQRLISIHLGAGCSICAIEKGKPLDTSMGFTPDEGLIMMTRSGDIDPGLLLFLVDKLGIRETKDIIEKKSGLQGMTNSEMNVYDIIVAAGEKVSDGAYKNDGEVSLDIRNNAKMALKIFSIKIKKYIGAYSALMNGVDTIAFTGKVGFYSEFIRDESLLGLEYLKIKNVCTVKPDEELAMAKEIINMDKI